MSARGFQTLVELLRARAESRPDALGYAFLEGGEDISGSLTYGELYRKAVAIAGRLTEVGASCERALLIYPPGLDYVAAFFGCLYAGVVAVPAYPPDPARLGRTLPRLRAIAEDARISLVLTTRAIESAAPALTSGAPELAGARWIATDGFAEGGSAVLALPAAGGNTLAFLQYTSGSTAAPKGVMVSHGNLLSNLDYLERAEQNDADTVSLSWLPAYHDMGLIEGILHPLYGGYPAYLMSPSAFLERPHRWLKAISRHRVTNSGGPNFAYDLCVRKITEGDRRDLDLRSWRVAYNGAEPIRAETLRRFMEAFSPRGFRAAAFYPVYGLAEATLLVSTGGRDDEPTYKRFNAALLRAGTAAEAAPDEPARELVACGKAWLEARVVIADPERRVRRGEGEIGEIWIGGPGVARGYWGRVEESEGSFGATLADNGEGPLLRTGDLGFLFGGELFVAGRIKDCIVLRGANHYPQDIELTVEESAPAARPGCSAAFSVSEASGEAVVVVVELDLRASSQGHRDAVMVEAIRVVREAVAERHGIGLHAVVLLEPRSIPKTSSGKIQRAACRAAFEAGELSVLARWTRQEAPPAFSTADLHRGGGADTTARITAWLVEVIAARAGVPVTDVDSTAHLTRYGLDSLASVELLTVAGAVFGRAQPTSVLLEQPSIEALARLLSSGEGHALFHPRGQGSVTAADGGHDTDALDEMMADAALAADIDPSRATPPSAAIEPRAILLTGATGFLGAYLLRELLSKTGARIHCLVRGGRARMIDMLRARGLWDDEVGRRVDVIEGDLRAPGLGLNDAARDRLSRGIDAIYHSAAAVNWVYPYRALRDVNVRGTEELLRLACRGALKPLHFVSTIAVCHFASKPDLSLDEGDDVIPFLPAMHLGYARSKAVAEALVLCARDRGLPAGIYRPSFVVGDSQSGATNTADFFSSLIKGCVQMRSAPDLEWSLDGCPVDHVARAIVALSTRSRVPASMSHITNPSARPFRELVLWMNALGYPVRLTSYNEWLADLERSAGDTSHALYYLRSFFHRRPPGAGGLTLPELYEDRRRPIVGSRLTHDALAELEIACPPLDARLLDRIFASLVQQGFLDAPRVTLRSPRASPSRSAEASPSRSPEVDPPLDAEILAPMLRRSLQDDSASILAVRAAPCRTEHSILTELTSLWHARASGLFNVRIDYSSSRNGGGPGQLDVMVKVKPPDEAVLDIGRSLAGACGERVAAAYEGARGSLAARGCHLRELAVYAQSDARFRMYTPALLGSVRDDERGMWALVLEHLGGLHLLDSADHVRGWGRAPIDAAIRGAAEIHAIWYGRERDLLADPSLASASLVTLSDALSMRPFWSALAEHAGPLFETFYGAECRSIHRALAEDVERWWPPLEALPRTLIHNDFNPRNMAMRATPGEGLRLCAYDWELAAIGAPQRDLAELLCFVLPPDVSAGEAAGWVELHRASLERAAGASIDVEANWLGLRSALSELLVNRLSMYSMAHAVRRQRFLPRVIATWRRLYEISLSAGPDAHRGGR